MIRLRSIAFIVSWTLLTFTMGVLCVPTLVSQRAVWWAARLWARGSLGLVFVMCGIRTHLQGLEHIHHAKIIAANHQSAWDTLVLWCVLKNPVFVLKRELYWIPVFGWYLWRTGQIGINRSKPYGVVDTIVTRMRRYGEEGRALVVFPQGTRSKPGEDKPFKQGIGRISAALQWPVVPAALNAGYFWPKRPWLKWPGTATLEFLPPREAATRESLSDWVNALQATIHESSLRLPARTV